ncbi:MAG TPA: DUF342 domain-containing protein [Clostridiaceae bacterium]|nr:DUF342 domain-containing protein [Clostridiaceae bacterium]
MERKIIFENEFLLVYSIDKDVYIDTLKKGFPVDELNNILSSYPYIKITSFISLRNAIAQAPKKSEKFGELKEKFLIEISKDGLVATIEFNLPSEELDMKNRKKLIREVENALSEKGIVWGVNTDFLNGEIQNGKKYVIAQGIPPLNGRDSIIRLYEIKEPKPSVSELGKVNFYDMQLINRVKVGDWLGERIEATEGVPGKTVTGEEIKPIKGRNFPLNYDKNSIQEIFDNYKTTLYSKINGAVNIVNGRLSVSNHLEIDGDVNPSTGNIKFDGYVTIKGTIADGFSVEATRDIEILGELGLGNIKGITSKEGSIFIKGGVSSKRMVEINAAKNVFTKYLDNAVITCGGKVHIGYYCINSNIYANEVIVDSSNGQIIGGNIKAKIKVTVPILGSEIERRTQVEVTGFNRSELNTQFENLQQRIEELRKEQQNLQRTIERLNELNPLTPSQYEEYRRVLEKIFNLRETIKALEEERKNIAGYLKTRGEGEISITKRVYPNCVLILKRNIIEIKTPQLATTYYVYHGDIKQV